MLRVVLYLIVSVLLLSVLRSVMGVILKGFADLFGTPARQDPAAARTAANLPLGGELKKDPECGTYIAVATSIKKTVGGETYHFCSTECRDKFVARLR
ncbi:MAG: YHS domain-containing protein [Bryobacteraceae bacterium]